MDRTKQKEKIQTFPSSPKASVSVRLLVVLAIIGTIYLAKMILLPIFIAAFIALFASPLVRSLERLHIPKPVGSLLLEALLITVAIYIAALLFEPALRWMEAAPVIGERLTDSLKNIFQGFGVDATSGTTSEKLSTIEQAMDSTLVTVASMFAQITLLLLIQTLTVIIIIYFFLVYGDDLMRNIVRAQGSFSDKRLTVVMFQVIRDDISMYILWVSLINVGLGLCTAGALALAGIEDAILWGTLAAVLNYAPYIGPLVLTLILTAVGISESESLVRVLLAPGIFLLLNLIESQFVTPTILGRRFNINPLLVVLWMFIWGWLWGVGGMLLAIPILMCLKLVFFHLRLIGDWVEILSGNNYHDEHHAGGRSQPSGKNHINGKYPVSGRMNGRKGPQLAKLTAKLTKVPIKQDI